MKNLAVISMTIDHLGFIIFPDVIMLRVIGRAAFPIFGLMIAEGYLSTRSFSAYLKRILIFAVIAQIPYYFIVPEDLNIMFTLSFGLMAIYCLDKIIYDLDVWKVLYLAPVLAGAYLLPLDYGLLGVSYIVFCFFIVKHHGRITGSFLNLPKMFYYYYYPSHLAALLLLSLLI